MPMIWHWPGKIAGGHRVTAPVANFDIAGTLVELLGIEGMNELQCASLWPGLLGGELPADRSVFTERAQFAENETRVEEVAVTHGRWRLHGRFAWQTVEPDTVWQLFDTSVDPWEQNSVVAPEGALLAEMQGAMRETWAQSLKIRAELQRFGGGELDVVLTDEERERLDAGGYFGDAPGRKAGKREKAPQATKE